MKDNKPTITEDTYPDGCAYSALPCRDVMCPQNNNNEFVVTQAQFMSYTWKPYVPVVKMVPDTKSSIKESCASVVKPIAEGDE